jgi:hypothetical protein
MGWARIVDTDLINDTSPQLGGDLDANGYRICAADMCATTVDINKIHNISGSGCYTLSSKDGGFLSGQVYSAGDCTLLSANCGGIAGGILSNDSPAGYCSFARINASGKGAFARGMACVTGVIGAGLPGAYSGIYASGKGSFANGYTKAYEDGTSTITSFGSGTVTFGHSEMSSNYSGASSLHNKGAGSLVFGTLCSGPNCAVTSNIYTHANARGSIAFGDIVSVYQSRGSIESRDSGTSSSGYVLVENSLTAYDIWGSIKSSAQGASSRGMVEALGDACCSYILASNKGSTASGHVSQCVCQASSVYAADSTSGIKSTGFGAMANGHVVSGTPNFCGNPRGNIFAAGAGSFATGSVSSCTLAAASYCCRKSLSFVKSAGVGSSAHGSTNSYTSCSWINAIGNGSQAFGSAYSACGSNCTTGCYTVSSITSCGEGSMAFGRVYAISASPTGADCWDHYQGCAKINASGVSSLAFGLVKSVSGSANTIGFINSSGDGSLAGGVSNACCSYYSRIISKGIGSIAFGYSCAKTASPYICATGNGSFALGFTDAADVLAKCHNTVQIGPGTNANALSLQVGTAAAGVRVQGDGKIYSAGTQGLASFSGAISNLTVVNGIVTAAS